MLVLSRKINEAIVIGGNIRITMTSIRSRQVRLSIEAPPEIHIYREELLAESRDPVPASEADPVSMPPRTPVPPLRTRGHREYR